VDGGPAQVPEPADTDTVFVQFEGGTFVTSRGDTVWVEPFELCRYETTNRLHAWLARRADLDLPPDPRFAGVSDYMADMPACPVVNVSAIEAAAAAGAMGCRLPTEVELEYAAASGTWSPPSGRYPWGYLPPAEAGYPASYMTSDDWELRNQDGYFFTAPVGSFPLTREGVADLSGNVAELTRPVDGISSAMGGAWLSPAEDLVIGSSVRVAEGDRAPCIGYRLAR
jgi:formylglycine-generating enzyme required for sulfatase activity